MSSVVIKVICSVNLDIDLRSHTLTLHRSLEFNNLIFMFNKAVWGDHGALSCWRIHQKTVHCGGQQQTSGGGVETMLSCSKDPKSAKKVSPRSHHQHCWRQTGSMLSCCLCQILIVGAEIIRPRSVFPVFCSPVLVSLSFLSATTCFPSLFVPILHTFLTLTPISQVCTCWLLILSNEHN